MLLPVIWVESQKFSLLQWMKPGLKKVFLCTIFDSTNICFLIMQILMHSPQKWVDMVMQADNLATTVSSEFA